MISRRTSRQRRRLASRIGVWAGLLVGGGFAAFPVLWMLVSSFKPNSKIFSSPPRIIEEGSSLAAYTSIFHDAGKMRFFANSSGGRRSRGCVGGGAARFLG